MPKVYKYNVLNVNEIVYTGYKWQVARFLGCTSDEVSYAATNNQVIGKCTITRFRVDDAEYANSMPKKETRYKPPEEPRKRKTKVDYLVKHLEEYGNTVLGTMSEIKAIEYLGQVSQRGINTKYTKKKDEVTKRTYYIIEKTTDARLHKK